MADPVAVPGQNAIALRVLVVDDHLDAADALAAVLDVYGYPARACHDGAEALVAAAEFGPHVCLLDLMMPNMDGLELARRLREQAGGRPLVLVAVTSLGDIEALTWTALGGFHAHLIKPVDARTLISTLNRVGRVFARPGGPTA
ncbi:response regulator [Frigoriglobus tundricola]|nr:response regulator [Frigoriglobus tundricola]